MNEERKYNLIKVNDNVFMSDDISLLSEALSKFQGEVKNPNKNKKNPACSSKYADFPEVLDCAKEPLKNNGLAVIQHIGKVLQGSAEKKSEMEVTTILTHKSGQYTGSVCAMVVKPFQAKGGGYLPEDTQADASATTYIRRYAYMAILGIAGDEDDDGNGSSGKNESGKNTQEKPQNNSQPKPSNSLQKNSIPQKPANGISEKQNKRMFALANGNKDLVDIAVKEAGYTSSTQVEWQKYEQICNRISELVINPPQKDITDEFCGDVDFEDVPF